MDERLYRLFKRKSTNTELHQDVICIFKIYKNSSSYEIARAFACLEQIKDDAPDFLISHSSKILSEYQKACFTQKPRELGFSKEGVEYFCKFLTAKSWAQIAKLYDNEKKNENENEIMGDMDQFMHMRIHKKDKPVVVVKMHFLSSKR